MQYIKINLLYLTDHLFNSLLINNC